MRSLFSFLSVSKLIRVASQELRHLEDFEFNSDALGDPSIAPTTMVRAATLCSACYFSRMTVDPL